MRTTFFDQLLAGNSSGTEISREISRWRGSSSSLKLHEYLGMTFEEYGAWVIDPNCLTSLVEARIEKLRKQKVRRGPYFVYDPMDMPTDLRELFYLYLGGEKPIMWVVGHPGGPWMEDPESFQKSEEFVSQREFTQKVDVWLREYGAKDLETVIFNW